MRHIKLKPGEFIPIQAIGIYRDRLDALSRPIGRNIPPVDAVEYSGKYLLVDGNHRVYRAMLHGEDVETRVLETDEDVNASTAISLIGCHTLVDILEKYEKTWKSLCEKQGVESVMDYRIQAPLS